MLRLTFPIKHRYLRLVSLYFLCQTLHALFDFSPETKQLQFCSMLKNWVSKLFKHVHTLQTFYLMNTLPPYLKTIMPYSSDYSLLTMSSECLGHSATNVSFKLRAHLNLNCSSTTFSYYQPNFLCIFRTGSA